AGREHDAVRPRIERGAQHVDGSDDVDVGIVEGVAHRLADVDLRRSVEDHVGTRGRERGGELGARDVQLHERRAGIDLVAPAAGQVVDHRDGVTGVDERVGDVRPDETSAAGDERPHPWGATRCALGTCTWVSTKMTNPITIRLPWLMLRSSSVIDTAAELVTPPTVMSTPIMPASTSPRPP